MDRIYYIIYCSFVFRTKYQDINLSYQDTRPHYLSKRIFFLSAAFYFIDPIFINSFSLFGDRKSFFTFGEVIAAVIFILTFWYFGRPKKVESIVLYYYNKRKDLLRRDARLGVIYSFLPIVFFFVYLFIGLFLKK